MKRVSLIFVICLMLFLSFCSVILASDTFDAIYTGVVRVTNNSTIATNVSVPFFASSADYIAGGYMTNSANNTAIVYSAGADAVYMPGFGDTNPWLIFVSTIGENSLQSNTLFMGGPTDMLGKIRYFPAIIGMNVTDSASLELGDNFTIAFSGFFNTDNGTDKNFAIKGADFKINISPIHSGNITASISEPSLSIQQLNSNGNASLYPTGVRAGFRYNDFPAADITKATFRLFKNNNPTGIGYVRVRRVSDDAIIGTLGSFNATSLPPAAADFDFTTLVSNPFKQDIRVSIEPASGDAVDYVAMRYQTSDDEVHTQWTTYNGTDWIDASIWDPYFKFDFREQIAVSIFDVSSGEHTIDVSTDNNSLLFGIGVDNTDTTFPITENLTMNAPLWHNELNSDNFTTKDTNELTANVTGAIWSFENGRWFDGINDQINFLTSDDLYHSEWTWEFWIYPEDLSILPGIFGTNTLARPYMTYLTVGGVPTFSGRQSDNLTRGGVFTDLIFTEDTWGHYTYSGNGTHMYATRNGILSAITQTYDGTIDFTNREAIQIGIERAERMKGFIAEARLYDRALSITEILQNYNATKWKYETSDEQFYYNLLPAGGVLDTSENWTFVENNVMPYMESVNITINGTPRMGIEWEYGTTFIDSTGNGNDATPSFRTTTSDPDVSASLIDFRPISEAQAPAFTVNITTTGWITDTPSQTGNFTTTTNSTYPGSDIVLDVTTAGNVPIQLFELIIAGVVVLSLSLFISWVMRTNREGSLFFKILIITAGLGVMIAVGIVDDWIMYLFLMISIALAMMASQRVFSGTGNSGNNLIGFLAMSFVGMTLINRILEGRFIQSTDVDILRDTLAFQPFTVFGLFTIPVPNTNFLVNGLPALVKWDYSFFGGNAQIFQYLLYSVTAVVSFMLFVLVFGAIYQMFSRGR